MDSDAFVPDRHRAEKGEEVELRAASRSNPSKVAGAIVKYIDEGGRVSVKAIGAGAVNSMMKAVTIARSMAASVGYDLSFVSGFVDEMIEGEKKTALKVFIRTERN